MYEGARYTPIHTLTLRSSVESSEWLGHLPVDGAHADVYHIERFSL